MTTTHQHTRVTPDAQVTPEATGSTARMLAAAAMVSGVFVLSNSPTPLYVLWQHQMAFASSTLALIFAAYILALLVTLLFAGRLSDRLGRKRVVIPGLLCALGACALFATATSMLPSPLKSAVTTALGVVPEPRL